MLLLLLACTPTEEPEPDCRDEGGGFPGETDETLAELEAQCNLDGGADCDPDGFIEVDAATCIAAQEGLAEGLGPWESHLVVNTAYRTVIWSVTNVEYEDMGERGGSGVQIQATTGHVFEEFEWAQME